LVAAAHAAGDFDRFSQLYRRGAEVLVAAMLFVPVVLSLVAVPLVDRVYGSAYHDAARPLQILAITLVLMTVNGWQAFVLLGGGQQRATLLYNLAALGVAAVACLILIHAYGMVGAAWATLCTSAFVLVCSTLAVRRHFDVHLAVTPLVRIVLAAAALWAALWVLRRVGTPWPALVAAGLALYPASLMAFGVLRLSTLTSWRNPATVAEVAPPRGRHVAIDRKVPPLSPILFEPERATAGTEA
jgi:O-antigen/teichoic acid export membrane protein